MSPSLLRFVFPGIEFGGTGCDRRAAGARSVGYQDRRGCDNWELPCNPMGVFPDTRAGLLTAVPPAADATPLAAEGNARFRRLGDVAGEKSAGARALRPGRGS
jgi:hypothetical protein